MMIDHADDAGPEPDARLMEILDAYLQAVESGQSLDRTQWLAQYPDLAEELTRFLDEQDRLMHLTEPLRPIAEAASLHGFLTDDMLDVFEGDGTSPGRAIAGSLLWTENRLWTTHPGTARCSGPAPKLRVFGDYVLIEPIAHGGMGTVFKARHRSLNRLVALKMVRGGALAAGEDLQRFRQEAEAVAHLDHPGIVPIYDVGEHDGFTYFSMKLVDGGSLAQRIAGYTADPRRAAELLATVARAVHHAHQRGILHRDLKPSNILLDEQSASPTSPTSAWPSGSEGAIRADPVRRDRGHPSYMAPEQAAGKRGAVTTAADVYGLGAVLYAMLTGRPPFQGDSVIADHRESQGARPRPAERDQPPRRSRSRDDLPEVPGEGSERRYASAAGPGRGPEPLAPRRANGGAAASGRRACGAGPGAGGGD